MYKFREFIDIEKLDLSMLCKNPNAIDILLLNKENLDWNNIALNPNAIFLIEPNLKKIITKYTCYYDGNLEFIFDSLKDMKEYNQAHPELIPLKYISEHDWTNIMLNPEAIRIINKKLINKERISYIVEMYSESLCMNPNAIPIIEDYLYYNFTDSIKNNLPDQILNSVIERIKNTNNEYWDTLPKNNIELNLELNKLCQNLPVNFTFEEYIEENEYINHSELSKNPNAIHLLEKCPKIIDYNSLSENPNAIHLILANFDKINKSKLSKNINALPLLIKYPQFIDWYEISGNPGAIQLIEKNLDKINWYKLSSNPAAIKILMNNVDKIDWYEISANPEIFELNYLFLKKKMDIIREELMIKVLHPFRISKLLLNDTIENL
jgi:hypothetical protein